MDESDGDQLKNFMLIRFLFILLAGWSILEASDLGGYTGTSNRMVMDPLSAGTGGITLFANTSDNAYTQNPAARAWTEGRNLNAGLVNLPLDRYIYSLNVGLPLPPTAHLSMGLVSAGTRGIEARDSRGYYAGDLSDSETTYFLSFSNRFSDRLAFGLSFKLLSKQFSSDEGWLDLKGSGFGAGLGVVYKATSTGTLAIAVKDWNSAYKWKTQEVFERGGSYQDVLPMSLATGWLQDMGMLQLAVEHDHYFIKSDIFRLAVLYNGLKDLSLHTGIAFEDGSMHPGLSARYNLAFVKNQTRLHIDLGLAGGVVNEGLRTYLGWGVNF